MLAHTRRVLLAGALLGATAILAAPPGPLDTSAHTQPGAARAKNPLFGLSGALRALVVESGQPLEGVASAELKWTPLYREGVVASAAGLTAPSATGIWRVQGGELPGELSLITPVHFDGTSTHLNGYHIGRYPARAAKRTGRFAPPELFIEVTPQNEDHYVSEHFQLRQFLTKDQGKVWPKYLPLDLRLIDKLELVIAELRASGVAASRLHVMSGYRTPQYNGPGGNGRAKFSRHTYGDAADVWVDEDGNGAMDDLNGDGRVDIADAEVIRQAAERVERRHPELVGGLGVYRANRAHGPFTHVDVGGRAGRWSR